jgi:hypothetical protein
MKTVNSLANINCCFINSELHRFLSALCGCYYLSSHRSSKHVRIICVIHKILVWSAVLYECGGWSLLLQGQHEQRLFQNSTLRGMLARKRDKGTAGCGECWRARGGKAQQVEENVSAQEGERHSRLRRMLARKRGKGTAGCGECLGAWVGQAQQAEENVRAQEGERHSRLRRMLARKMGKAQQAAEKHTKRRFTKNYYEIINKWRRMRGQRWSSHDREDTCTYV